MGIDTRSFALGVCTGPLLALAYKLLQTPRVKSDTSPHPSGLKVVINGSTRGLGFQMARQFLMLGDDVVITSRSQSSVDTAVKKLTEEFPGCKVVGVVCDVSKAADVERLAATAADELGQIDIWICSAAQCAKSKAPVAHTAAAELQDIVRTNLEGALLGAKAAISRMMTQHGGGKVFLVGGAGSRGEATSGNAAYGATKAALEQLRRSLAAEVRGTNVAVHIIGPGMMPTDIGLQGATNPRTAWFINTFAEEPPTVAAWLVPRIRGVDGNGVQVNYVTPFRFLWRLLTAKQRKGRFLPVSGSSRGASKKRLEE